MTMITENEAMNLTDTELVDAWSRGNDAGDGWAPGEGCVQLGRNNPSCYDEWGGYCGPGAESYGGTQSVFPETDLVAAIESADGTILRTIYEGSGGNSSRMYLAGSVDAAGHFAIRAARWVFTAYPELREVAA